MFSSDDIVMADFGLCLENDSYEDQIIPNYNAASQTAAQVQQVQWPQQQPEPSFIWQNTMEQPMYQANLNRTPTQNHQFIPNCQYKTTTAPIQVQWPQQQTEPSFMWQNTMEQPMYQENLNQCQYVAQPTQNHQFLLNCQYKSTSAPIQQPSGNQMPTRNNQFHSNKGSSHLAKITIVHAASGTSKAIIKRKRKRTAFTTEQILALEQVFSKKPYVNRDDRQALVEKLQVSDRAIKVWFQNRRIKSKREEMEASSSEFSPLASSCSSDSFGLAYVEHQMSQHTDEFGYVTLDDRAIGELVNVIDTVVTDNVRLDILGEEQAAKNVLGMEYEPVSPAATSSDTSSEEAANWSPPEPEQSLRQLFEFQHRSAEYQKVV